MNRHRVTTHFLGDILLSTLQARWWPLAVVKMETILMVLQSNEEMEVS